ncbi:MAG: purine-cytosine permease family protein [Pseudonocardiaceae bacterium]
MSTTEWIPEQRSVEFVPLAERHGRVRNLFTLWFGANMQVTTIVAGAINIAIGLSLPWALISVVIGNLFGAVFMALHSAQGPRLGIPQMIQSRAQFGHLGAVLPLVLIILMYLGSFAVTGVQGGQALVAWAGLPVVPSITAVSTAVLVVTLFGYRLIHAMQKWVSLVSALAFAYLTIELVIHHHDFPPPAAGVSGGTVLLGVALSATWQLTYAPYVADYSRYLPENTSVRAAFWYTYAGSVLGAVWMMSFGAIAVSAVPNAFAGGSITFIVDQAENARALFFFIILLGITGVNSLNLYGLFMSVTTTLTAATRWRVSSRARVGVIVMAAAIGTLIGIFGHNNFLGNFQSFILLLAYFLIPWTAINLMDFYLIRREIYDIDAIFNPAGRYGGVDTRAMIAYFLAVVAELPFVSTSFFTGPAVAPLGEADISWIVGLVVAAAAYWWLMRRFPIRRGVGPIPAPDESAIITGPEA